MNIQPIKTNIFKANEPLLPFLDTSLKRLPEGAIVVVTSKIVALAEGRIIYEATKKHKEAAIQAESERAIHTDLLWLTQKDGVILANAGVDISNGNGHIVLLPKNSFAAAEMIHSYLCHAHKRKHLGVIITDSRSTPLRRGVSGIAVGYAGFRGLKDYRGKKDIFGLRLSFSQVNVADSLAAAAVLTMGEGNEKQPLAVITDAVVQWTHAVNPKELLVDPKDDLYRPWFDRMIE